MPFDEIPICQIFGDDRIGECVQERDVRAVLLRKVHIGDARRFDDARVGDDESRPPFLRLHDAARNDRMAGRGVVADKKDTIGFLEQGDAHAHGTRSNRFHEPDDRSRVAGAGAVVDVVRAQARPHEFLHDEVRFVARSTRRAGEHDRFGTVLVNDALEALSGEVECLVPAHAFELGTLFATDHRMGKARRQNLGIVDEVVAVQALQAELSSVRHAVGRLCLDDIAVFYHQVHLATRPAVRTYGYMLLHGPTFRPGPGSNAASSTQP